MMSSRISGHRGIELILQTGESRFRPPPERRSPSSSVREEQDRPTVRVASADGRYNPCGERISVRSEIFFNLHVASHRQIDQCASDVTRMHRDRPPAYPLRPEIPGGGSYIGATETPGSGSRPL